MRHMTAGVITALMLWTLADACAQKVADPAFQHFLWTTAHAVPAATTSEQSGYFSIIEGHDQKIYVGTAKYGSNAYLVEFDPRTRSMRVVVDAQREIGNKATGFAAQAKIHTRNNVGRSGRIYFATKQGYPKKGEQRSDYAGGFPMVYDPRTGKTRVYPIPVAGQGVISITPDESRGVAYISTCSDERPTESTHFMVLDLKTGKYTDLMDCRHMYSFIVIDHLGRAYHPILGGDIARYDPATKKLERLRQTIDGKPPSAKSLLATAESHPINWDISPDRKTLYAVAMSGNQLFAYDLTQSTDTGVLAGRSLGPLIGTAQSTDCRALCVGPDGTVWAGIAAKFPKRGQFLHLVSYRPGSSGPVDRGPLAIGNPDYVETKNADGKVKPYHHGVYRLPDNKLLPRYVIMGICAARDGTVYVTTLYPFTVHAIRLPKVAGITTTYYHNSHADMFLSRLLKTDTLDGKGHTPTLELTSLYTEQVPTNDISRRFAKEHQVPIYKTVDKALTRNTNKLAVDGVLLIAEHGDYPESDTGQLMFPKRQMFSQCAETFRKTGRTVPVFLDKHLADTWQDAKWIYDRAQKEQIPLMAGSSLPVLWRYPPIDVERDARLKQIVAVSYHRLDTYGFHALEMVQSLVERRSGGETGVKSVRCIAGQAVWEAERRGVYDRRLLDAALSRLRQRPIPKGKDIHQLVPEPVLFVIDYNDGLRACILTLNQAVIEWAAAWQYEPTNRIESTLFWTQELRPFQHFSYLLMDIERFVHTRTQPWPVERTLLTSGTLDALLVSKRDGGKTLQTPWLNIRYRTQWNWRQPPDPPPGRPIREQ